MTSPGIKISVFATLLFFGFPFLAVSQSETVFITNYDVRFNTVTNNTMRLHNNGIKVRSGDVIPYVEFNTHRVDLKLSAVSENKYTLETIIFEKAGGEWVPMALDIPDQEGELEIPLKLDWKGGDLSLDVAIIVGT